MVMPRRVARFNRVATNRAARPLAGRVPGFGLVRHRGRRSGRTYRTPVFIFAAPPDGYVVALVYGPDTDWVRNVQDAGGCDVRVRGRWIGLTEPRIAHDETRRDVPRMLRPALRALGVADFLHLRVADG
jgi:deazaflavin-dependent oxidoreductase (nitroreductase family)